MASRRVAGKFKKTVDKVIHPPYMMQTIPAGQATSAPPLGPMLGQRGIPIGPFCQQFNDQTKHIKPGIPIPAHINIKPDKSVDIVCYKPSMAYFLKLAAGIKKGARKGHEVAGKVTVKHVYEIAKIKSTDPSMEGYDMKEICKFVIHVAHTCGIQVVTSLDPVEYRQFLDERKDILEEQEKELEQIRQAKLLRI